MSGVESPDAAPAPAPLATGVGVAAGCGGRHWLRCLEVRGESAWWRCRFRRAVRGRRRCRRLHDDRAFDRRVAGVVVRERPGRVEEVAERLARSDGATVEAAVVGGDGVCLGPRVRPGHDAAGRDGHGLRVVGTVRDLDGRVGGSNVGAGPGDTDTRDREGDGCGSRSGSVEFDRVFPSVGRVYRAPASRRVVGLDGGLDRGRTHCDAVHVHRSRKVLAPASAYPCGRTIGSPRRSARPRFTHIRRRSSQKSRTARRTTCGFAPVAVPAVRG